MTIINNKVSLKTQQVNCPTCQKKVAWIAQEKSRPFCSERCQLIDFGDWANEKNSIVANDVIDDFDFTELDNNE